MNKNIEGDFQICISIPLRISSVNVTKSAVNYGFRHIYWENPSWKSSFLCGEWCIINIGFGIIRV